MTPLGRMIRDRMDELGIVHQREAALASGVNKDTVNRLLTGQMHGPPKEDTLRRIAAWTGRPIQDVREAAGRPRGEAAPFVLPDYFHELNALDRDAVLSFARSLHTRSTTCTHHRDDGNPSNTTNG